MAMKLEFLASSIKSRATYFIDLHAKIKQNIWLRSNSKSKNFSYPFIFFGNGFNDIDELFSDVPAQKCFNWYQNQSSSDEK